MGIQVCASNFIFRGLVTGQCWRWHRGTLGWSSHSLSRRVFVQQGLFCPWKGSQRSLMCSVDLQTPCRTGRFEDNLTFPWEQLEFSSKTSQSTWEGSGGVILLSPSSPFFPCISLGSDAPWGRRMDLEWLKSQAGRWGHTWCHFYVTL